MSDLPAQAPKKNALAALVARYEGQLQDALNQRIEWNVFTSAVQGDLLRNPKLLEAAAASPSSVLECLLMSATLGLLPGAAYEQFYMVPFKVKGQPTVKPIIGYKGLCRVAQRHPRVHSVEAFLVYEGEPCEIDVGEGIVRHRRQFGVDRSDDKILGAYSVIRITAPETHHVVDKPLIWAMDRSEIDAIRNRSQSYRNAEKDWGHGPKRDSPWHTDYSKMARKTVLRAHLNGGSVPVDLQLAPMLQREAELETVQPNTEDLVDLGKAAATRGDQIAEELGLNTNQETTDDRDREDQ